MAVNQNEAIPAVKRAPAKNQNKKNPPTARKVPSTTATPVPAIPKTTAPLERANARKKARGIKENTTSDTAKA